MATILYETITKSASAFGVSLPVLMIWATGLRPNSWNEDPFVMHDLHCHGKNLFFRMTVLETSLHLPPSSPSDSYRDHPLLHPFFDLVFPDEAQRARTHDQDRPHTNLVAVVERGPQRLNGFPQAHLVPKQATAVLLDRERDALLLEGVQGGEDLSVGEVEGVLAVRGCRGSDERGDLGGGILQVSMKKVCAVILNVDSCAPYRIGKN